jgi:hypothetical protein
MNFSMVERGKSLCRSCRNSLITKDSRGVETVACSEFHPAIFMRPDVSSCNRYVQVGKLTDWEAQKIGWVLEVGKDRQYIGFRPPKKDED